VLDVYLGVVDEVSGAGQVTAQEECALCAASR
jgi:hypothetical protein